MGIDKLYQLGLKEAKIFSVISPLMYVIVMVVLLVVLVMVAFVWQMGLCQSVLWSLFFDVSFPIVSANHYFY